MRWTPAVQLLEDIMADESLELETVESSCGPLVNEDGWSSDHDWAIMSTDPHPGMVLVANANGNWTQVVSHVKTGKYTAECSWCATIVDLETLEAHLKENKNG